MANPIIPGSSRSSPPSCLGNYVFNARDDEPIGKFPDSKKPSTRDVGGSYALLYMIKAVKNSEVHVLREQIKKCTNINEKDRRGRTLIHYAARLGASEVLEILIQAGANLSFLDSLKRSALHYAANAGYERNVKLLTQSSKELVNVKDEYGCIPLHYAAKKGNLKAMEVLLAADSLVKNVRDKKGCTILHYAASSGNSRAVLIILEYGEEASVKDDKGRTPLEYAPYCDTVLKV